jgi:hypothetical protein
MVMYYVIFSIAPAPAPAPPPHLPPHPPPHSFSSSSCSLLLLLLLILLIHPHPSSPSSCQLLGTYSDDIDKPDVSYLSHLAAARTINLDTRPVTVRNVLAHFNSIRQRSLSKGQEPVSTKDNHYNEHVLFSGRDLQITTVLKQ